MRPHSLPSYRSLSCVSQTYDAFAYWGCFTAGRRPKPLTSLTSAKKVLRSGGGHHVRSGEDGRLNIGKGSRQTGYGTEDLDDRGLELAAADQLWPQREGSLDSPTPRLPDFPTSRLPDSVGSNVLPGEGSDTEFPVLRLAIDILLGTASLFSLTCSLPKT